MSQNTKKITVNQGFTLIEFTIVIVLIGVIIAGMLSVYKPYLEKQFMQTQEKRMAAIQVALSDFVGDDPSDPNDPDEKRLPCPAPTDVAPSDPNFGLEQCITGAVGTCTNGVCLRAGTAGELVMVGSVPTKTLDISSDAMIDASKNRITYAVSQKLTLANSMPSLTTTGSIEVIEDSGTITTTAPFALISHGKNKLGATTHSGTAGVSCSTSVAGDGENCDNDSVFRNSSSGEINTGGVDDYDDSIRFNFDTGNLAMSGRCPAGQMMVGYDPSTGPICENAAIGACPDGEIMSGMTATGPICNTMADAGLVEDFPSSTTQISVECVDASNPYPYQSLPRENSPWQTVRFFNTCGARFCKNRGYDDGMVKEVGGHTGTLVRCYKFK